MDLIKNALDEGRTSLSEYESKQLLSAYKIPVTKEALVGNRESLIDAIGKIGMENEEIEEIDINPLIISGNKPVAVDALVVLGSSQA